MKLNSFCKTAISLLLVAACFISLVSCGSNSADDSSKESSSDQGGYTVTLVSDTGAFIENATVFIYSEDTLADLVAVEHTDANGTASFELPEKEGYTAVLSNIPEGYAYEDKYPIKSRNEKLVLTTVLPEDADRVYTKGDLMYNFNFTDVNGKTYKLSELLKTKKAVVLNFWYTSCNPCGIEFPYLNEAYELYKDTIEVIAVNPTEESVADLQEYAEEKGLTMPIVSEKLDWQTRMDITAYPTTVVIDRHGRICLVHEGYITDTEEFTKAFAYFTAEDYKQTLLNGIGDIDSSEESKDADGNPTEVGGVTEFEMTVEAGKTEYCDVYKISNMNLTVDNPNAVIIYNGEEYAAKDGIVSLYVVAEDTFTPIKLGVKNSGNKKETFKIMFTAPLGSSGNPYPLNVGSFETKLEEGNDQGVFYKYVAQSNGTLTLECAKATEGVAYDYVLYNLNSYALRNLSEDGEEGKNSVSIEVKKGHEVTLTIATLPDSAGKYPAASFTSVASFTESDNQGENSTDESNEYSVTVTYSNGKTAENVQVRFDAEGDVVTASTNGEGKAFASLKADSCTVYVTVPSGYVTEAVNLQLSKAKPNAVLKLYKTETKEFTVTVKDKNGNAVKDATITINDSFKLTDSKGQAKFNLPASDDVAINYTAAISLPDGYSSGKTSFDFEEGKRSLDITVEKRAGGENENPTQKLNYTVTVKKADGSFVSNVSVVFEKNGATAAVKTTNANGVASADLEKGAYTAKLIFADGVNLNYDKSSAKLTESNRGITVIVAEPVSNDTTELYVGNAYQLSLGGNYCKLNGLDGVTYMVFIPERSGTYSFTTSYSNSKISYYGANTSFIFNQTNSTDYTNNRFTLNIKEDNLGAFYIIGVEGDTDCVVIVELTGDAVLGISDLPWTIYEAKKAPTAFTLGATKFTADYFDITGKTDDYKLVYNSDDGCYHLGSKNGKTVYLMLGEAAPYLSFAKLLETTGLKKYFYDAKGSFVKKEDYTECMMAYAEKADEKTGLYPLTDDLIYIIKESGDFAGWWDKSSATYLFSSLADVNTDIAWMFALCTVTIE